jgi:hypothetical protein
LNQFKSRLQLIWNRKKEDAAAKEEVAAEKS